MRAYYQAGEALLLRSQGGGHPGAHPVRGGMAGNAETGERGDVRAREGEGGDAKGRDKEAKPWRIPECPARTRVAGFRQSQRERMRTVRGKEARVRRMGRRKKRAPGCKAADAGRAAAERATTKSIR